MLSLSEVGSWINFAVFCIYRTSVGTASIGALVSISFYIILNISHAVIHARKIMPTAPKTYKTLFTDFKCSSNFLRIISYIFSFKFSMI